MKYNYPSGYRFFRLGKLVRAKTVRCVRWTNLQTVTYRLHARARCIRMLHQQPIRCCSKVLEHCDEFLPGDTPEYFFDKNPENFTSILNIYRTGNSYLIMLGCKTNLISVLYRETAYYWLRLCSR